MKGTVRWYSAKGFGFIDVLNSPDGRAIYFHLADVKGRTILKPGDAVTFDVVQVPKGPKCINVRAFVLDTKEEPKCPQTQTA
jgi:cold shock protein